MCLTIDTELTSILRMSGRKRFTVWKKVIKMDFESMYHSYHYQVGQNAACPCREVNLTSFEKTNKEIHEGIHVFLEKPKHPQLMSDKYVIIPLTVYLKDMVAAGYHAADYYKKNEKEAVFTKVHLSKRDAERSLRR